jgi:hypothetical protein
MADEQEHPHRRTAQKAADPPAEEAQVEATSAEVEATAGEAEAPPDYYPPQAFSPWELPANTVAAQQYMNRGLVVDESLVPEDDRLAAANNEIELYGHPDDPRLSGGSLVGFDATALPSREVEIEQAEVLENTGQTWGAKLEAAESEEATV